MSDSDYLFKGIIGNSTWVPEVLVWTLITWMAFVFWFFRFNSRIEPYVRPRILEPRLFTSLLVVGLASSFLPGALSQGSLFIISPLLIPLSVFFLPILVISSPFGFLGFILIYSVLLRNVHYAQICLKERLMENKFVKLVNSVKNPFPRFYRFIFALFPIPLYILFVGKATNGRVRIQGGLCDWDSLKLIFSAIILYPPVIALLITRSYVIFLGFSFYFLLIFFMCVVFLTFLHIFGLKWSPPKPFQLNQMKDSSDQGSSEHIRNSEIETDVSASIKDSGKIKCLSCDNGNFPDAKLCNKCGFNLKDDS